MSAPASPEVGAQIAEASANPPCHKCNGLCCRSYIVPVTGFDVWRISTGQRLAPESYLVAGHQREENSEGFMLDPDGRPYFLALDKRGRFNRYQPCVFLMSLVGGEDRCGIYSDRPSACKVYPMTMSRGEVHLAEHAICPTGSWPQREMERPTWREAVKRTYIEADLYTEVVARWNARVARSPGHSFALTEYLSYLMNVHSSLSRLESDLGGARMARIESTWPTPPRVAGNLDEMMMCRGDLPWLDFLVRARAEIDHFYPEIPPQPVIFPISSEGSQ